MTIFVFGNPDLAFDSLPLKILPELKKQFPDITFVVKDPNEEWDIPEEIIVLDTVMGIDSVKVFHNLDSFARTPSLTMHDFDAITYLKYLQKLGKIKKTTVIGVPSGFSIHEATSAVATILRSIQL